ncbi:hypothetical protein DFH09DRAFT_1305826 [Mycena vulgaris]|nr:hypothetical protein DFH09DRAFT_1305826 [Mycena vulgaris]
MPTVRLDLSTEILLQVLKNPLLPPETVYSLALLCRRLDLTALPVYFARRGLNSHSEAIRLTLSANGRDLLSALRTALSTLSRSSIPLRASFRTHPAPRSSLSSNISILDARGSMCLSVGSDDTLRSWACHFGNLLNCIIENGCTSLTIAHGGYFTKAYELSTTNKHARRVSRYQGQIRALLSARRAELCGLAIFTARLSRGKSKLNSHYPSILDARRPSNLPRFIDDFLQTRGIASVWGVVLPLISSTAAKLTSVSFLAVDGIADADIAGFVASLPDLTHLHVDTRVYFVPVSAQLRPPHLTHLAFLHATPDFIRWIVSREDSLSTLHELIVRFLSIGIDETVTQYLSSIIRALDARKLTPSISLEIHSILWSRTSSPSFSTDVRMSLDRIAGLEIILE